METEMKYAVPDKKTADAIWYDPRIGTISDLSSAESVKMKAVYFDTEDGILRKNQISVRVRSEGDRYFATLKWGGQSKEDGLHQRNEINIPINDDKYFIQLDASVFAGCKEAEDILAVTEGRPLINLIEMRFVRRRIRLTYKNSVMELSLDNGNIITDKGEVPIMEMEIELFAGKEQDIQAIGTLLAQKYNLTPKLSSKFSDGLRLLNS